MPRCVGRLLLCLLIGLLGVACSTPQEPAKQVEENTPADQAATRFAGLLGEMAACLEESEPSQGLQRLRAIIEEHRSELAELGQRLQQQQVGMDEEQRSALLARHEEEVRLAMQRFARAQQSFRDRASSAQSVELSELLNTLR